MRERVQVKRWCCVVAGSVLLALNLLEANGIIIPRPRPPRPGRPPLRPAAVKEVYANVQVRDQVAKTEVREVFVNPNRVPLEGTFLLPIPPEAKISDFSFFIDGKEVQGEILPQDKALAYYRQIVSRMIDPALLEYAGKGLIRVRLFPIPPRGEATVRFSYTELLRSAGQQLTYWYPFGTNKFSPRALKRAVFDIHIVSSLPLRTIYAPHWPVDVRRKGEREARVSFEKHNFTPKEDFVLYVGRSESDFGVTALSYRLGSEDGFVLLAVSPKQDLAPGEAAPKDVLLVFDTSGSMAGEKIEQARRALTFCIRSLNRRDRFNIVTFSTGVESLFTSLCEATPQRRKEAEDFVKDLKALGGTNINEALMLAVGQENRLRERPFMVVFLTDGIPTVGVTDWKEILKNVSSRRPENLRLFVFGVGNDVNTVLLDRLAEENRGTRHYVRPGENLEVPLADFWRQISEPVLTDVRLSFSEGGLYDLYPPKIHDIFAGQQLIVVGRYRRPGPQVFEIAGRCGGKQYRHRFPFTLPECATEASSLPRLWAARKVGYLLDEIRLHGEKRELVQEVRALARRYGIVTPYTSYLVTGDREIARVPGGRGRSYGRRFGLSPQAPRSAGGAQAGLGRARKEGKEAVDLSEGLNRLKRARTTAPVAQQVPSQQARTMQTVGSKTFYRRNGVWVDSTYREGVEEKKVEYLSEEYFALLREKPELAPNFALGSEVVVCLDGIAYRVTAQKKDPDSGKEGSQEDSQP